jgi:hypothetical protein
MGDSRSPSGMTTRKAKTEATATADPLRGDNQKGNGNCNCSYRSGSFDCVSRDETASDFAQDDASIFGSIILKPV